MDDSKEPNESTLFTVRIWRHHPSQTSLLWRGKVQDVSSGTWRYFHNWESLVGFLKSQMHVTGKESALPPEYDNQQP